MYVALAVYHDVARLHVEMPDAVVVYRLERVEYLGEGQHDVGGRHGVPHPLDAGSEAFAFDEVHDIVGCAVLVEEVVYLHDVCIAQSAQSSCLLAEFLPLSLKGALVFCQGDSHLVGGLVASADALDIQLLDSHLLVEGKVGGYIGVAKSARRQILLDAVLAVGEQGTDGEQPFAFVVVNCHL